MTTISGVLGDQRRPMVNHPWIEWTNFRGFESTGRVQLKPITIVLGANNSGKSSLYKPLLLMQQTAQTRSDRPGLVTRGENVNAGGFEDIVPLGDPTTAVGLTLGLHTHRRRKKTKEVGHYAPGKIDLVFCKGESGDDVSLKKFTVSDIYERMMLSRTRLSSGKFSLKMFAGVNHGAGPSDFDKAVQREIRSISPEHFLFSGSAAMSAALSIQRSANHEHDSDSETLYESTEMSPRTYEYLRISDFIYSETKRFLSSLNYVGPLRETPKRVYELSGETPESVGFCGEFAPELLFRNDWSDLRKRLNNELRLLGFDEDLETREVSSGLFELGLVRKGWSKPINIADLGFGVSQLLPLLVQGLILESDEYLVAEQPEIHLNPNLQSRLADFFVRLASNGRKVIAETHSEHLLLRLRRHIAEGAIDSDEVGLYFVEMQDGKSRVREVPIDEFGHIHGEDWPKNFFGEGLADSLALATAQSQRKAAT